MQPPKPFRSHAAAIAAALLCALDASRAAVIFSDNFDSGASSLWGNESGSWSASGGVYAATQPNNFPNAFSSLPFNLANFALDLDINGVSDGGLWLRSTPAPGTAVGVQGVLLVLKYNEFGGGVKVYWHIATDGTSYGDALNLVVGDFPPGSNPHVRVEVSGDTYAAFINGATTPITTLTTTAFSSGRVALYDFSGETFDNFVLQAPGLTGTTIPSETVPLIEVRWQSTFGSWYQLQISSANGPNKWTDYGSPVPGDGSQMSAVLEAGKQAKFIRVVLLQ